MSSQSRFGVKRYLRNVVVVAIMQSLFTLTDKVNEVEGIPASKRYGNMHAAIIIIELKCCLVMSGIYEGT